MISIRVKPEYRGRNPVYLDDEGIFLVFGREGPVYDYYGTDRTGGSSEQLTWKAKNEMNYGLTWNSTEGLAIQGGFSGKLEWVQAAWILV